VAELNVSIHFDKPPVLMSHGGVAVREDTAYTDASGVTRRRIQNHADQALARLGGELQRFLEKDEAVLYVARALRPVSTVERWTFGLYIYAAAACVLVVTNRRILHLGLNTGAFGRWSWAGNQRSVRLGDLADVKIKGVLTKRLVLKYRNGTREKYWGIRRQDGKKLSVLWAALLPASMGENSAAQAMVQLCPDCVTPLTPGVYACRNCSLAFKSEGELRRRSILFPGGGYFYTGRPLFGLGDAVVECFLLGVAALWLLVALGWPDPFAGPLDPYTTSSEAWIVAGFMAFLIVAEKLLTIHHGRFFVRTFLPERSQPRQALWAGYAVVAYGLVGLAVWSMQVERKAIAVIPPDVEVYSIEFGTFRESGDGGLTFTPSSIVPAVPGQDYGWVCRFRSRSPSLIFEERLIFPDNEPFHALLAEAAAGGDLTQDEAAAARETPIEEAAFRRDVKVESRGGLVGGRWTVEDDEEPGRRVMTIQLGDTQVGSFEFSLVDPPRRR
jgi:hypothetical protein